MSTIHITFSFLLSFIFYFLNVSAVPTRHVCRPEQRDALLEFKNEFEIQKPSFAACYVNIAGDLVIPYSKTESWKNNSDCCYWDGIWCDAKSGEVIVLDLNCSSLHGRFHSNTFQNFRFLKTLDLSYNDLYGQIPSSIGKLSHLTSLILSFNKFSGQIPSSIGNLTHLTSLYLSNNQFLGQIPSSIENLSHLSSLHLSDNQFSGQIMSSIGTLSHLTSLDLSSNRFSGQIPYSIGNLSHLTSLTFSSNQFLGHIPYFIGNLSHLEYLDLNGNNLDGEIPSFLGSLKQLASLNVASNKFSGNFPIALLNLTNLSDLLLSRNQFTGMLPPNITLLGGGFSASDNAFFGTLPSSLFTIPSCTVIDLSNNQLNDTLEFGNISSPSKLDVLDLSYNNFRGPIQRSISKFVNLRLLLLSHLGTQYPIDLSIFSHLKSLKSLDLSGNLLRSSFSATNKSSISDPPSQQIIYINLSSCRITEFPELLRTQQRMETLDISNNKIEGQVPGWLWTLPNLTYVNLSNNSFISFKRSTKIRLSSVLEHLFSFKNNFTGKIPSLICELRSLKNLDLSNNNFNGSIPLCMGNLKSNLSVLNLRQNRLIGGLPENVFGSLRSLDLGHNQLVGKLPRSLIHFSTLEVLNVESNRINDTFPFWLRSLQNLQVLALCSNAFHGPVLQASFLKLKIIDISHNQFNGTLPSDYFVSWSAMSSLGTNEDRSVDYMEDQSGYYHDSIVLMNKGIEMELVRILTIYTALDFSGNRLEGEIPKSIGLLKELHVLNLSSNAFTSHIPSSMGNLTALESLDVSQNKLSGVIPQELGNLSYLAYMNFSHNLLVGLVPGGTQFRRQPCSSFKHNSGLFGPALDEVCRDIHTPSPQQSETPEPAEEDDEVFSWIAAAIGFVPGIAFGLTIGYILVSYKPEWFTGPFGRNKRRSRSTTTH